MPKDIYNFVGIGYPSSSYLGYGLQRVSTTAGPAEDPSSNPPSGEIWVEYGAQSMVGPYSGVAQDDGTYADDITTAYLNYKRAHYYRFNVTESLQTITGFRVGCKGYCSSKYSVQGWDLKVWNNRTSSWEFITSITTSAVVSLSWMRNSNLLDYIDSNGRVRILALSEGVDQAL